MARLIDKTFGNKIKQGELGVTLLEVLIYIGIFSAMILITLVFVFGVLDSSSQISVKINEQEEGNFLLNKLNWAINEGSEILLPPVNSSGDSLNILGTNNLEFLQNGNFLTLNGTRLNSQSVKVKNFLAIRSLDIQGHEKINIEFWVGSQSFSMNKYLK
jgi:hypothetical protein